MENVFVQQLKNKGISLDFKEHLANNNWIDGGANIHKISEMDSTHLMKTLEFLEDGGYNNTRGIFIAVPEILNDHIEQYKTKIGLELKGRL